MDVFFVYLISAVIALIALYAVVRWIDFGFTKLEDKRRYKMAKGCIRCYNNGQKTMAKEAMRAINDNLFDMFQKMGDL